MRGGPGGYLGAPEAGQGVWSAGLPYAAPFLVPCICCPLSPALSLVHHSS